jgi:chain length determinant protein (polysaccharide antigen chain regulator)
MGSDYLSAEIHRLKSRGNSVTADDPFIPGVTTLLSELSILNNKSFEFEGARLYTLDKLAAVGDAPVKPNKRLIVIIGVMLSGFLAIFIALIVATVKKRKLIESKE